MLTGIPEAGRKIMTAALKTALVESPDGATLKLFKNDFVPGPFAALVNFTEADFVGYAKIDTLIDWLDYRDGPTGDEVVECNIVASFAAGAIVTPQTVYGWYLVNNAESALEAFGRFDDAFTFVRDGDTLTFTPKLVLAPSAMQSNNG